MKETINVNILDKYYPVEKGITLEKLYDECKHNDEALVVAAVVNNEIKELTFPLEEDCSVRFIDISEADGGRIYQRSAKFLLIKAVHDLYPEYEVEICHSVSRGIYFEVAGGELELHQVSLIEKRMWELVREKIPYVKLVLPIEKAKRIFLEKGRKDRFRAVEFREKPHVSLYVFDDIEDYFYGYMVPNTSYINMFKLEYMNGGIILVCPDRDNPARLSDKEVPMKIFQVFSEYRNWIRILGVEDVGLLNKIINKGNINEFIRIQEALHEKKIAEIADLICSTGSNKKAVLIAGPSSSGKTTFAQRLSIQLRVNGLIPVTISLDDYFVDKTKTPIGEDGLPDLEALETLDLKLFNKHLNQLVSGEEIEIPEFNFFEGRREYKGKKMRLDEGHILVIEGIHGLNPRLTSEVSDSSKFKVYVSAITSMRIDHHNRIPTTDSRLIRRIVRDYLFRGCSAPVTLDLWPKVRKGEEKNIFPYQEEADVMFNSALLYELGVLKRLALPLLNNIGPSMPQYTEARRLIEFLSYFKSIETKEIPLNSILREFVGGSCFYS